MTIVHIGLPKTATTFWQHRIFKKTAEIDFLHRKTGDEERDICVALRSFCHGRKATLSPERFAEATKRLAARVDAGRQHGRPVLISDENISVSAKAFWRDQGPSPSKVAGRIARFFREEAEIDDDIRILVGVRSQAEWLASRYAQSEIAYAARDLADAPNFTQADFDRRLGELAETEKLHGAHLWLDYAHVRKVFGATFGRRNVIMVPMERLADKPRASVRRVGKFIGLPDLVQTYKRQHAELSEQKMTPNRLSTSENTWKLGDGVLTLAPEIRARLDARFAESNQAVFRNPQLVGAE